MATPAAAGISADSENGPGNPPVNGAKVARSATDAAAAPAAAAAAGKPGQAQPPPSNSPPQNDAAGGEAVKIDAGLFNSRLDRMWAVWEAGYQRPASPWHRVDALILLNGPQDDERSTPKTALFHLWLIGYEFPDTLMAFTRDRKLFFLTGPKKLRHLRALHRDGAVFLEKKNDESNTGSMEQIKTAIAAACSDPSAKARVGRLRAKGEEMTGAFVTSLESVMSTWGFEDVKMDLGLSKLLNKHDAKAQVSIQKAGTLATLLAKEVLVARIELILDGELVETHASICRGAEKVLDDDKKSKDWKSRFNLNPDVVDVAYVLVQSGTNFDLRPHAPPSPQNFHLGPGCIIVAVGSKYVDYTANVTRTLLLDATEEQKVAYQLALDLLSYLTKNLRPGASFKKLYESARAFVEKRRSDFVDKMVKNMGHVIGLEFGDPLLTINGRNENVIEPGMAFNISVGFSNIPSIKGDSSSPTFAVWLADTVIVKNDGSPHCVTDGIKKTLESIYYRFKEEGADGGSGGAADGAAVRDGRAERGPTEGLRAGGEEGARSGGADTIHVRDRLRTRRRQAGGANAEALLAKQITLRQRKLTEIERRVKEGGGFIAANKKNVRLMTSLNAYKDVGEFPKDLKQNKIQLDTIREALLVPINGVHVPFHVSTIRNVVCSNETKFHTLRINFQVPGNTTLSAKGDGESVLPEVSAVNGLYIKELTFKSSDDKFAALSRQIKEIQKKAKSREAQEEEKGEMAPIQPLQLNRTARRVLLKSLMVRSMGVHSRRVVGTLEAHMNGLRFQATKMENLDINYTNIKHAVFQPCEREMVVLIHFHLRSPVVVNKKKTTEIQFFTETGNLTDDLDQRRSRSTFDPDEIAEEQREKELKKKLNLGFKRFVEGVEEMSRLEFEIPYRELAFKGVPKNSQQELLPTASCVVHLTEWPPFILTLEDVELVCFERVSHGLRSFDIVFINKDYSRSARHVSNVNIESLDTLKKWLNEVEIAWYEVKSNLNWDAILKTIRADLQAFVESGGFDSFLAEEGTTRREPDRRRSPGGVASSRSQSPERSAHSDDSDEDDEYKEEDSEEEEEEEDSSEESLDESSEGSYEADSDEEEGPDWDELEEEAMRDDRKRGYEDDKDESAQKSAQKRKKTRQ